MTQIFFDYAPGESYRQMSTAVHSLIRCKLAQFLSISVDGIIVDKDERGRPYIIGRNDIFISLSHCKGLVMCAFSDKPIGVDIECVQKRRKSIENRVFTASEISLLDNSDDENKAFFRLWTLKESYLKAIGTGFANNAKDVEFLSLELPIKSNKQEYEFSVGECDGFVYSLCEKIF